MLVMLPSDTIPALPECPGCRAPNAARLQQVLRGTSAIPVWVCARCENEWPADPDTAALFDRRAERDRRAAPRHGQVDRRRIGE
jgi:hypothetical protein